MACNNGPYCLSTGGFCGCNCGCCPPCPCYTKFKYKILHGTPNPDLQTSCDQVCVGGKPNILIVCAPQPLFRKNTNQVTKQDGCTGLNPSDPAYPNDQLYPDAFTEIELTFDGCCMYGNGTSFTTVGSGTLTATSASICGGTQTVTISLNGGGSTLAVDDCTPVTVSTTGSGPCCSSCIVLITDTRAAHCGGGDTDPCVACRGGKPIKLLNRRTQKIVSVSQDALMSHIRKKMTRQTVIPSLDLKSHLQHRSSYSKVSLTCPCHNQLLSANS